MSPRSRRPTVAVLHPWLPQYRVEFFERLRSSLDSAGVTLELAHGVSPEFAPGRGDERSLTWAKSLRDRRPSLLGRTLVAREPWAQALSAELLVMEDGLRNVDTYAYLAGRKARRLPVAFWGHGRTMDKAVGGREEAAKRALLRMGDWWFAYTEGVAEYLSGMGIPPARTTALQNTFATESLISARQQLAPDEVERRRSELGLSEGHTCLFIGGLSESKNLDLLIEAGRLAALRDPLLRVVVAGDGPQRPRLEMIAKAEAWLLLVGPVFADREKALLAAACDVLAVPGLVGLVAVDSFAMGIPIVAIEPWNHAPEFEYLRNGENSLIAGPQSNEYAEALLRLLGDRPLRERLARACRADSARYTLDSMVSRFADGALAALAAGRRRGGS